MAITIRGDGLHDSSTTEASNSKFVPFLVVRDERESDIHTFTHRTTYTGLYYMYRNATSPH